MNSKDVNKKENLDEISFIRPILIILLIIVHCFTAFNGVWEPFVGFHENLTYMWIARFSHSFLLETFIFISGYIWAFQIESNKKKKSFKTLVNSKLYRILLPSFVFSLIYFQLFDNRSIVSIESFVLILSGFGHLWYLPVLFWCFIIAYFFKKLKLSNKIIYFLMFFFALLPYPGLPLQLNKVPYYLFFFHTGVHIWQYRNTFKTKLNIKNITFLWVVYIFVFIFLRNEQAIIVDSLSNASFTGKIVIYFLRNLCQMFYSGLGVICIYSTSILFTQKYKLYHWYVKIGSLCFGVYIFQEFIIKYLYYYTDLPLFVGYIILPWLTFVIALVLSLLLSITSKSL